MYTEGIITADVDQPQPHNRLSILHHLEGDFVSINLEFADGREPFTCALPRGLYNEVLQNGKPVSTESIIAGIELADYPQDKKWQYLEYYRSLISKPEEVK